MTPQEALHILNQATGMIQLNRADHESIAKALQVIDGLVNPKK